LDRIDGEAEHLNRLIGQLLTLARLNSTDAQRQQFGPVGLSALVQDVAEDAQFEAQAHGRKVDCQCHWQRECIVTGDRELLRSAIENIIRNAIRYTAAGTAVEVGFSHALDSEHTLITIRDHGPGVPQAALQRIFEPFYRANAVSMTDDHGTGLGLAIALRAIALHNGTIEAANNPGGGLSVAIKLPVTH
jgi:two-component system sensor histidine kinase CpxA